MNVLYDYSIFQIQSYGGISRYFYELITMLSVKKNIGVSLFEGMHINEYGLNKNKKNFTFYWGYKVPPTKHIKPIYRPINNFLFELLYAKNDFDIFHPTYYRMDLKKYTKSAIVLTAHDMIHELFPEQFKNSQKVIKSKKVSFDMADVIICVSENTKKDLMHLYDVPKEKIKVIYHANDLLNKTNKCLGKDKLTKKYPMEKPFLLYVGNRGGYKNFKTLLDSYLTDFSDEFDLVCFGGGKFNQQEIKSINRKKNDGKIINIQGPDSLLIRLYKFAFCLVYPSLYEGFGIPPLEAMSLGCPVVASNASSIPEVVGNAALLFNPSSKEELMEKIKSLNDEKKREKLIKVGFKQEKKYSWDKTAEETLSAYKYAAKSKE